MAFINYKNLYISNQTPTGSGGNALQHNFSYLANTLEQVQCSTGVYQPLSTNLTNLSNGSIDSVKIGYTTTESGYFSGGYIGGVSHHTEFDNTGHQQMVGDSRPWRDELGDLLLVKQQGAGVSTNVTESTIDFATNSNLDDYLYLNVQLNHDRDLSANIYPHIHFFQAQSNVPNILLQYRWQVDGGDKQTSWTNLACNDTIFAYTSGTIHQIADSNPISPPANSELSDIVQFRILRDNANTSTAFSGSDPYTATVGLLSFDVHLQIDSLGSTTEYVK